MLRLLFLKILLLTQVSIFAQMNDKVILTDLSSRNAAIDSLKSLRGTEKFSEGSLGQMSYTGVKNNDKKAILTLAVNNAIDTTIAMLKSGPILISDLYKAVQPFWKSGDPSELRLDTDDSEVFFLYFVTMYRHLGIEFSSDYIDNI